MDDPCVLTIEKGKYTAPIYKNIFDRLNFHNITTTNNYLEIKSVIEKISPYIIIADLSGLNEPKALKILDNIKSIGINIPLIVVTEAFSFEIKNRLKSFRKKDSFIKPIDVIHFTMSIKRLITSDVEYF